MDRILLHGIRLTVHLGVPEAERAAEQTVIADVECERDVQSAGRSDHFADTIDYAAVHEAVRSAATARPYALVEAMAEAMAAAVLEGFDIRSVRVLVRKPGALQAQGVDWAGVEIVRSRRG